MFEEMNLLKKEQTDKLITSIYDKVENSEKLLQLILANELIDQLEMEDCQKEKYLNVTKEVKKILKLKKLEGNRIEKVLNRQCFFIDMTRGISIQDIKEISMVFYEYQTDFVPVFNYKKVNGNQKKALIRAHISFCVEGKEFYLFEE